MTGPTLLIFAALVLGLQHGIDWDHIAAIADLTASAASRRRGFSLATWYVLGHAAVVLTLGLLAVWAGLTLPDWMDDVMEPLVGITLIGLALWILVSLGRDPNGFRLRSRWMLVAEAGRALLRRREVEIQTTLVQTSYTVRSAVGVGVIHGIGAETPSQVLLFLAAAGAGGPLTGTLVLLTFVLGLVTSNTAITLGALLGFQSASARRGTAIGLGLFVAAFSLVAGILFLTGRADLLPSLAPR